MECQNSDPSFFPIEVIKEILSNADFETLKECELVCKLWNAFIKERGEKYQEQKEMFFSKRLVPFIHLIPTEIISAIGGSKALSLLPKLDIGDNASPDSNFNPITPKMMSAPIMRGVDRSERPFISIIAKVDSQADIFLLFSLHFNPSTPHNFIVHSLARIGRTTKKNVLAAASVKNTIEKLVQGKGVKMTLNFLKMNIECRFSLAKEPTEGL